jgi:hypothetical protein
MFEIVHAFDAPERQIIADLQRSVDLWRKHL